MITKNSFLKRSGNKKSGILMGKRTIISIGMRIS